MRMVNMHEAKSQLSNLVEEALSGEEIFIARAGRPLVKLVPLQRDMGVRTPGRLRGQIVVSPDFDETPTDIIDSFEGTKP